MVGDGSLSKEVRPGILDPALTLEIRIL
jgi:hypothetical protein